MLAGILLQGMYYQLSTMQESYADYITINDQEVIMKFVLDIPAVRIQKGVGFYKEQ